MVYSAPDKGKPAAKPGRKANGSPLTGRDGRAAERATKPPDKTPFAGRFFSGLFHVRREQPPARNATTLLCRKQLLCSRQRQTVRKGETQSYGPTLFTLYT